MMLMILCGILCVAGLAAIAAWGGKSLSPPAAQNDGGTPLAQVSARVLWWAAVVLVAGAASGLLMSGPGGRLIMRLLAATSPEDQGRFTEAGEIVGRITLEGTLEFLLFAGVAGGSLTAILYAALHRWLPQGRAGGVVFGLLLLVGIATTLEPMRSDNIDFAIVGPGWLSVAAFSLLAVAHGMLVAAMAGWLSRRIPLLGASVVPRGAVLRRQVPAYLPLAAVLLLFGVASVVLLVGMALAILLGTAARMLLPRLELIWRRRWVSVAGQILIVAGALVAVPGFVGSITSILQA